MLMSTMTNDNDIALKFKVTIRILFLLGQIIVLIIRIRPNSKDLLFGTALITTNSHLILHHYSLPLFITGTCTVLLHPTTHHSVC